VWPTHAGFRIRPFSRSSSFGGFARSTTGIFPSFFGNCNTPGRGGTESSPAAFLALTRVPSPRIAKHFFSASWEFRSPRRRERSLHPPFLLLEESRWIGLCFAGASDFGVPCFLRLWDCKCSIRWIFPESASGGYEPGGSTLAVEVFPSLQKTMAGQRPGWLLAISGARGFNESNEKTPASLQLRIFQNALLTTPPTLLISCPGAQFLASFSWRFLRAGPISPIKVVPTYPHFLTSHLAPERRRSRRAAPAGESVEFWPACLLKWARYGAWFLFRLFVFFFRLPPPSLFPTRSSCCSFPSFYFFFVGALKTQIPSPFFAVVRHH